MLSAGSDEHSDGAYHQNEGGTHAQFRTRRQLRQTFLNGRVQLEADQDLDAHDQHSRFIQRDLEPLLNVSSPSHSDSPEAGVGERFARLPGAD